MTEEIPQRLQRHIERIQQQNELKPALKDEVETEAHRLWADNELRVRTIIDLTTKLAQFSIDYLDGSSLADVDPEKLRAAVYRLKQESDLETPTKHTFVMIARQFYRHRDNTERAEICRKSWEESYHDQ